MVGYMLSTRKTSVLQLLKRNLRLIFFTSICAEVQVLVSVCITQEVFVCGVCVCVRACIYVCLSSSVCMVGVIFVYVDIYGFYGYSFLCLVGRFSMITLTPTVLSVLYACVLYFCIWTCSAQLSMFHMERCSRNMLIIILLQAWLVRC